MSSKAIKVNSIQKLKMECLGAWGALGNLKQQQEQNPQGAAAVLCFSFPINKDGTVLSMTFSKWLRQAIIKKGLPHQVVMVISDVHDGSVDMTYYLCPTDEMVAAVKRFTTEAGAE